jgi:methylmalonyl-CoA mutase N-terminal domain/subunit
VEAIETGYTLREIARSAYEQQRQLETGERVIVGVNKFTGENEIEVIPPRLVPHAYDPKRLETAKERQKAKLNKIKEERDQARVNMALKAIREAAKNEKKNLIPYFIDVVKAYCIIGEICDVLRDVFGVWEPKGVI